MKKLIKNALAVFIVAALAMSVVSCSDKKETKNKKSVKTSNTKTEEVLKEPENEEQVETKESAANVVESDEQKARAAFSDYVSAAKKLDFKTMEKYIPSETTLPMLESYKKAYSKYNINNDRIEELCKARLAAFSISPISAVKSGNDAIVTAKIMSVNMELLQNKWMETLCNKYPEYTSLSEDEMTPENVDVLIQVMIDVLKKAEPTIETNKEFVLTGKNGGWIINATSEDIFPSN